MSDSATTPGWRILHNPRCSKSREVLALLREAGIEPEVVEYLKQPPTTTELDPLCRALGVEPAALVRFKEARAIELGLSSADDRPRAQWLQLLAENPQLIERPIVVRADRAVLGRPPEAVRQLF